MSSWAIFDDVFGFTSEGAQSLADEQYAVVVEITISYPQKCKYYKTLTLQQKINCYIELFNNLKAEYNATSGEYCIEYHVNKEPHLHGHIEVNLPANTFNYSTSEMLRMFAKSIYLKLPKSCYKQFAKADINEYLKRFKAPAVCLNIKNVLKKEWVNYCNKET